MTNENRSLWILERAVSGGLPKVVCGCVTSSPIILNWKAPDVYVIVMYVNVVLIFDLICVKNICYNVSPTSLSLSIYLSLWLSLPLPHLLLSLLPILLVCLSFSPNQSVFSFSFCILILYLNIFASTTHQT